MRLPLPLLLLLAVTAAPRIVAAAAPSRVSTWVHRLVADVTANQVAAHDWTQGGDNSLSWGLSLRGRSERTSDPGVLITGYTVAFGQSKLGKRAVRKLVDRLEMEMAYVWETPRRLDPYLRTTLKTQMFRSYDYTVTPRRDAADFMDPAYGTHGAGYRLQLPPTVDVLAGAAVREIGTRDINRNADDENTAEVEKLRIDAGLESVMDVTWQRDHLRLQSHLEVFVPFTQTGDAAIGNEATLVVSVAGRVHLHVDLQVRRDPTWGGGLQLRQATALGLRYLLL